MLSTLFEDYQEINNNLFFVGANKQGFSRYNLFIETHWETQNGQDY